ncbi:hypothetical protein H0G86_007877 [Trichoderma simmonsii]|uniref:Uncharacterized protein n=1 Tax=Trichoderma simmonsii TaxID=1491479 RepID=A0A8G0LJI9_9HYPO|nr:hypothetical protein H0G86_007877 [Trichoderma simmonsii]
MAQGPPPAQKGGVEACSTTRTTRAQCAHAVQPVHGASMVPCLAPLSTIGGLWPAGPILTLDDCSLVDRPFSVRELQFCGRKGGMGTAAVGTPRALHCNTQHSTAYVGSA